MIELKVHFDLLVLVNLISLKEMEQNAQVTTAFLLQ
jgi:hypothetical protein